MSTGLERPGGTSSGLPPALLTSEIEQKPTSRAPGAAGLLLFDFACSHEGTTALLAVLVGAPESAPPGPSIPRRHLESIIQASGASGGGRSRRPWGLNDGGARICHLSRRARTPRCPLLARKD